MRKLHLHIDRILQGEFKPNALNLMLLFQVNCPGCFSYALPLFNKLYDQNQGKLGFLALSTAFEDFDLNTEQSTELLIKEGKMVGETKRALLQQGHSVLPYQLDFPIGVDTKAKNEQLSGLIEDICFSNPNFSIWSEYDQKLMRERVSDYLGQQEQISLTFTANQFRGTPTIVLFNKEYDLLDSWFGHTPIEEIEKALMK